MLKQFNDDKLFGHLTYCLNSLTILILLFILTWYWNSQIIVNTFVLKGVDVDTTCEEFENGSALHIAAANLSLEAAKALLGFGADVQMTDELVRH